MVIDTNLTQSVEYVETGRVVKPREYFGHTDLVKGYDKRVDGIASDQANVRLLYLNNALFYRFITSFAERPSVLRFLCEGRKVIKRV